MIATMGALGILDGRGGVKSTAVDSASGDLGTFLSRHYYIFRFCYG